HCEGCEAYLSPQGWFRKSVRTFERCPGSAGAPPAFRPRINSAVKMSPAMPAGLSKTLWDVADIVKLVEDFESSERKAA
ncbi:MAG TPA: hypothetical protein VMU22_04655, partial [Rhizomicrobium sp.]|nr:hypothetical protein [Rhizomicrobium sp.]